MSSCLRKFSSLGKLLLLLDALLVARAHLGEELRVLVDVVGRLEELAPLLQPAALLLDRVALGAHAALPRARRVQVRLVVEVILHDVRARRVVHEHVVHFVGDLEERRLVLAEV